MRSPGRSAWILVGVFISASMTCSAAFGQVAFSDAFQKTIKRIAKEKTKESILSWATREDPVVGIVAGDLIGQVLDSKESDQLISSNISVLTTMLFIYRVQSSVEVLLEDSSYCNVISQAREIGWAKRDLVAYSSLYYYYSERLKRGLFVSPYILNMNDVRGKIESLRSSDGKKWVAAVSGKLVQARRHDADVTLDVRAVEILRIALLRQFSQDSSIALSNDFVESMLKDYFKQGDAAVDWIETWNRTKSIDQLRPYFFGHFLNPLRQAINRYSADSSLSQLPFNLRALNQLTLPFASYADIKLTWTRPPRYSLDEVISNLRVLLNDWLTESGRDRWGFGYKMMLSGTYLSQDQKVDFTLFDHLRFGHTGEDWTVYGFVGGFIDPLIKHSLNKEGSRTYLVGVGGSLHGFNFMPAIAIPYDNLKRGRYQFACNLGYEIPIADLTE